MASPGHGWCRWKPIGRGGSPGCAEDCVFDRLLADQAELEGLQLVSLDPALAAFPCRVLW
ncbi:MAG: hypothetical protein ACKOBY_05810 [Cyanobium sp.]